MPARLAGGLIRNVAGGLLASEPEPHPEPKSAPTRKASQRKTAPKPLDDVTIARKVESIIFRDRKVAKGKIDVNVVEGVVWLRGEAKTPNLIKKLEGQAREVPEVRGVENLLHLPKTPAPSRTDTPPAQRKTRRSPRGEDRRTAVRPPVVTEEAAPPAVAEPSPTEVAASGTGRAPAPLGATEGGATEGSGPATPPLPEEAGASTPHPAGADVPERTKDGETGSEVPLTGEEAASRTEASRDSGPAGPDEAAIQEAAADGPDEKAALEQRDIDAIDEPSKSEVGAPESR
jgi:hypothetical protein